MRVGRRELALGDRVRFGNIEFELTSLQPGVGLANVARLGSRFRRADRTVQIAVVIGILCVVLLGVTIVVALNRGPRKAGDEPAGENDIETLVAHARFVPRSPCVRVQV